MVDKALRPLRTSKIRRPTESVATMKKNDRKRTKGAGRMEIDLRFVPVVRAFDGVRGVTAGKLFASYGLKVNGKIFAMFGRGRLVVKLPKEQVDEMVNAGKAERFDPGHGRVMKEWAALHGEEAKWVELAREAYRFVKENVRQTGQSSRE